MTPGRRGKRADLAPHFRADERGKLVDRIVDECVVVHERTGERSAEKRLDAATPKWSQIITSGFRAVGCAEQMAVYRESVRVIKVEHRLFGVAKRQAGGGGNLVRQAGRNRTASSAMRLVGNVQMTARARTLPRDVSSMISRPE